MSQIFSYLSQGTEKESSSMNYDFNSLEVQNSLRVVSDVFLMWLFKNLVFCAKIDLCVHHPAHHLPFTSSDIIVTSGSSLIKHFDAGNLECTLEGQQVKFVDCWLLPLPLWPRIVPILYFIEWICVGVSRCLYVSQMIQSENLFCPQEA